VLERLFRGSIINYRTFFMEEHGICGLRFAAPSILKALHKDRMNQICNKYPKTLGKTFNQYKFKISKEAKAIPLDYVMVLPSRITDKIKQTTRKKMLVGTEYKKEFETRKAEFQRTQNRSMTEDEKKKYLESYIPNKQVTQFMQKAFYLENVLKNETIRQIVKIRAIKEKRSLKEAVKQIVAERKEKDAKKRNKLKKKKERQIEDLAAEDPEENDGLYSRTTFQMDRLLKVLTTHSSAIDSLEKKLFIIQSTKRKEKQGSIGQIETNIEPEDGSGGDDRMFKTGEIEGFDGAAHRDDLDFIDTEENERDDFMEQLNQGHEPDQDLMAPFRRNIEQQKRLAINEDQESLNDVTSDESEKPEKMSEESGEQ